jgi:Tol biopolymer transport system component
LISGQGGNGIFGTWALTPVGGEIRKLQDATVTAVSPDGSRIAFLKQQQIWQMGPGGENPTPLFPITEGRIAWNLSWSPDGRWLTYLRRRDGQAEGAVLEAHLPGAGSAAPIFEDPDMRGFSWVGSGHIVVDRWEDPDQPFSNLWEINMDSTTMRAQGKPRRLTNWAGFSVGSMNSSRDGKRLAVTKRLDQSDVFIGHLAESGSRLEHLQRFTVDDRVDWPGGWGGDSKWLLFQSDRTGRMGIFTQRVDTANAEAFVTNHDDNRAPLLSPDGQWVLYFAWQPSKAPVNATRLMRMPASGGSPEIVLEAVGIPGSPQKSNHVIVPTTTGQPAFRCPLRTGATCVLSEAGQNEVVFRSFTPVPGAAKSEIFRIQAKAPNLVTWDLSPDGAWIAYSESEPRSASVHVRELKRGVTQDISIPGLVELTTLAWAADARSLFVTNWAPAGSSLLRVTLDGKYSVLYTAAKEIELPKASPDGRSLAFGEVVSASNVWLIEGLVR